ncbi:MAG: DM13 domain-containing protein [Acidimicrobiales bacterium]
MRQFINNHKVLVGVSGVAGLALVAFLAFGVFGIHTAFIDNEVSEAGPVFASGASVDQPISDDGADEEVMEAEDPPADESDGAEVTPDEPVEASVQTVVSGSFEDSSIHSGTGDAVVLSDGTQTFLRFEDNFATDNGPDLNVYLRANDGSGEYLDLGDLKGNIGSQNYEVPAGTDLSRFTVVDVWCVRFGVSFTEAQLA